MVRKRGIAGGALVAIIFVVSMVGIACGGSTSQPAGSPASSGAGAAGQTSSATGSAADGQDYRSIVVQRTKTLQQSSEELSVLLISPQMRDSDWKSQVTKELSTWSNASAEAQQLTPPDGYRAFHEKYLAGLSQFEDAADYLQTGIANQNLSAVGDARGQITLAGKTIKDASSLLPKQ
ncbi:MAG TPA: hypothetical protein VFS96_06865 [Nitrolancea sp.]|nr:hypothetical protein [Nitrolancea sp.]